MTLPALGRVMQVGGLLLVGLALLPLGIRTLLAGLLRDYGGADD